MNDVGDQALQADQKQDESSVRSQQLNPPTQPSQPKSGLATRVISSVALLAAMTLSFWMGHVYYSLLLIAFGFQCYWELINIYRHQENDKQNGLLIVIEMMPPVAQAFYLLPKTLVRRTLIEGGEASFKKDYPLAHSILFVHHTVISASFLLIMLLLFTFSLKKGQYKY